jgi:hypothetical protein
MCGSTHRSRWDWRPPACYLAPLALSVAFWGFYDSAQWASAWQGAPAYPYRLSLALLEGLGAWPAHGILSAIWFFSGLAVAALAVT